MNKICVRTVKERYIDAENETDREVQDLFLDLITYDLFEDVQKISDEKVMDIYNHYVSKNVIPYINDILEEIEMYNMGIVEKMSEVIMHSEEYDSIYSSEIHCRDDIFYSHYDYYFDPKHMGFHVMRMLSERKLAFVVDEEASDIIFEMECACKGINDSQLAVFSPILLKSSYSTGRCEDVYGGECITKLVFDLGEDGQKYERISG